MENASTAFIEANSVCTLADLKCVPFYIFLLLIEIKTIKLVYTDKILIFIF